MTSPVRVLVVDDQELVRNGYRLICSTAADIEVVGEAADGAAAVAAVTDCTPDVIIMDIRMPGLDGIDATEAIVSMSADGPAILVITTFEDEDYIYRALAAGATSFLLKDATPEEILKAIRLAAQGVTTLAPGITTMLVDRHVRDARPPTDQRVASLTEREREVLSHLCGAQSNAEIAELLHVSERTIKSHITSLMKKLKVSSRVEAVVYAYEHGLVSR